MNEQPPGLCLCLCYKSVNQALRTRLSAVLYKISLDSYLFCFIYFVKMYFFQPPFIKNVISHIEISIMNV